MAVIWLFFLVFPIADVLERSGWERIAGLVVIALFAAIYSAGFVRFPRMGPSQRLQNLTLALLVVVAGVDRKSTRLNSSHVAISYAVFCLKKKKRSTTRTSRGPS